MECVNSDSLLCFISLGRDEPVSTATITTVIQDNAFKFRIHFIATRNLHLKESHNFSINILSQLLFLNVLFSAEENSRGM